MEKKIKKNTENVLLKVRLLVFLVNRIDIVEEKKVCLTEEQVRSDNSWYERLMDIP